MIGLGIWEVKNIYIYIFICFSTKLRRLSEIDFISVSRKHNNNRYQLAVPLASLNKDHQSNGEIKTIFHLVRIIFEAHYWKKSGEEAGVSTFTDG